MGCGSSKSASSKSNNKVHGHSTFTASSYGYPSSTTQAYYNPSIRQRTTFRDGDEYEYVHKPKVANNNSTRVMYNSEEQNDDTFNEYIQRAGQKIRTGGSSNIIDPDQFISITTTLSPITATTTEPDANYDQQFSDFIQIAKKKLRTTSRVAKNNNNNNIGSFRRG